jgi:hypothetical protein
LPGATTEGFATPSTIDRSLQDDSPTVMIDAETGERVPHFAELDMSTEDDARRTLLIRPVVRLADATRYIVAIRGVVDETGAVIDPPPAFAALRDGTEHTDPSIEQRRGLYADIFARLADAGVQRETLQLAWDYTTSSRDNNTARLLHMRDDALAIVGDQGPQYTITEAVASAEEGIALEITGTFDVPLYLDQPGPGARLLYGDDGMPEINADMPSAPFPFRAWIPQSAADTPAAVAQHGHGLFSSLDEPMYFELPFAAQYNYVIVSTNWSGMAEEDEIHVGAFIDAGRFEQFEQVIDRMHQGVVNQLLLMRMVTRLADDPMTFIDGSPTIDPSRRYYFGSSQGGIMGGTYMALSTDVTRGLLDTGGQPYDLLLTRSEAFDDFFVIIKSHYDDAFDIQLMLAMAQMLWDAVEPNGWTPYLKNNPLPGTPSHDVIIRPAIGDHQVTPLGAHIMARTIGAAHLDTGLREVWGLQTVPGPHAGSALAEYDFGLPPAPVENIPQTACDDPHDKLRRVESGRMQLDHFWRTGEITNFCNGPCTYPDLSGC